MLILIWIGLQLKKYPNLIFNSFKTLDKNIKEADPMDKGKSFKIEKEINDMKQKHTSDIKSCHEAIKDINTVIKKHIEDEDIRDKSLHAKVDKIQYTIENVQVNGRKGLNESFQDIYSAISDLKNKEKQHLLNKPIREVFRAKTWLGKAAWGLVLYVLITTILHSFGVNLDLRDFVKFLAKI